MSQQRIDRFRDVLNSARTRDGAGGIDTTVITGHLAQMRMFMLRQGVEFYPRQDTYGFRKRFLTRVVEENEIDARLEGVADDHIIDGKGLWFFRPVGDTYRIMWFQKENYRAYYDSNENMEEVDLIYSFRTRAGMPGGSVGASDLAGTTTRYVRLQVRRDVITETISESRPSFDIPLANGAQGSKVRTTRNSLGFIPAVESFNVMRSTGMDATGDFDPHAEHILIHNDLIRNIRENIKFFGNPTLVSSRPKHELTESDGAAEGARPTIASKAGFANRENPSTRHMQSGDQRGRVARVVAGVEGTDRFVYVTPDAVSADQNLYARQYREELRTALGGVDELGISSGATAYEIKSLFGRAATTAVRKCRGLLTYGLCKLLAMMIHHEERVFRESFAMGVGLLPPDAPIREQMETDEDYAQAIEDYEIARSAYEQELDAAIEEAIEVREFPPGVMGLIPDGDPHVEWRWRGPVFEESTDDILNNSIVVRNLQELGVNSVDALRHLFPSKTDEERSAMLNGYPFRMAQATQQSIGTFLSLIDSMRQIPHPQAPDLPLLADARLDLIPFLYRAFDFLKRELTYAGQYGDAAGASGPAELNPIERARANLGLPLDAPGTDGPEFVSDSSGPGAGGRSLLAAGVPEPDRRFERDAPIPGPGSLLAGDPTGGAVAGLLPFSSSQLPSGVQLGDADLGAPSNAGLFADTAERLAERPAKRSSRRVSGKSQRRKSAGS